MIIVEYCPYGNLQSYLRNNRNNFINLVDESGHMKTASEENKRSIEQQENPISLLQEIEGYLVPNSRGHGLEG